MASAFQDMDIIEIVKRGGHVTGEPSSSPLLPFYWKPAITSPEELPTTSAWRREALQVKHSDGEREAESGSLHGAILEEVKLGHLAGPFSQKQLDER